MKRFKSVVLAFFVATLFAQAPAPQEPPKEPAFVQQAHQLMHDGKLDDALSVYKNELKTSPDSQDANLGAGVVLDLMGKGPDARKYFEKALASAPDDERRAAANRAIAMSWAFEGNCQMTVQYEQKVLDYAKAKKDFFRAGEIADEEGRVCLDGNDVETGIIWYKEGRKLGLQEPEISQARKDLWDFRWENAQARMAARVKEDDDPKEHIAAAKAILDRGTNPQQVQFLPALVGYVAFYQHDYKAAIDSLQQANQNDPFIQSLMAQNYEALGQQDKAIEFYKKAAAATGHNPAAALAVPLAKRKLATK